MITDGIYSEILKMVLEKEPVIISIQPVSGGCINQVDRVHTDQGSFIIKINKASLYPEMFEKEAKGLSLLFSTSAINVTKVIGSGIWQDKQFLVLSFLSPAARRKDFWENFGRSMANLHSHTSSFFGLGYDNYIGSLEQVNPFYEDWVDFFITNRLQFQLNLAIENKLANKNLVDGFESLYKKLPELLPFYKPGLLHGDLWTGNIITDETGSAALIDPAVYYGNPEIEIAYTYLFGRFDEKFYSAYSESFPLEPGFKKRIDIYNLYPLLVHVNLFGRGYLADLESILSCYK